MSVRICMGLVEFVHEVGRWLIKEGHGLSPLWVRHRGSPKIR